MDEDTGGKAVITQKDLEVFVNVANGKEFDNASRDGRAGNGTHKDGTQQGPWAAQGTG